MKIGRSNFMDKRRLFLIGLMLIVALLSAGALIPVSTASHVKAPSTPKYEMLVMGDSVVWGQGLEPEQKFTTLVKNEIGKSLNREVNVVNKSHSGATIRPKDKTTLVEHGEVPLNTPTLWQQLDAAITEYKCEERTGTKDKSSPPKYKCKGVDLVLLDGGINDIGLPKLLSPFTWERLIRKDSRKYCFKRMKEFLDEVLATFENATVVVTGYYPIICAGEGGTNPNLIRDLIRSYLGLEKRGERKIEKSDKKTHDWLIDRMSKRSAFWKRVSDEDLKASVDGANETAGSQRAVFVKVDFKTSECYAASDTKLWRLQGFDAKKNPMTDDHWLTRRIETICPKAKIDMNAAPMAPISRLFLIAFCKPAGSGHPNEKGSRKYADAILAELRQRITASDSSTPPKPL